MAELLTDEILIEKLEQDGFMMEPDGPWLLEYIYEEYGGKLDTTSDFVDDKWTLKIYSECTYDGYDIFWCTYESRPYVSQDGYYYEDYSDWSTKALEEWWQDVYEELSDQKKEELLDSGDYYEEKEEE